MKASHVKVWDQHGRAKMTRKNREPCMLSSFQGHKFSPLGHTRWDIPSIKGATVWQHLNGASRSGSRVVSAVGSNGASTCCSRAGVGHERRLLQVVWVASGGEWDDSSVRRSVSWSRQWISFRFLNLENIGLEELRYDYFEGFRWFWLPTIKDHISLFSYLYSYNLLWSWFFESRPLRRLGV